MTTALIGYTGFVGSNLRAAREYDELYNSANVAEIAGRSFETVVFTAAKAEKWRINQNPDDDVAHIEQLKRTLESIDAERLVLVSTIDVYRDPVGVTEETEPPTDGLHPYGLHRLGLEAFATGQFPSVHIVRLPGLFGPGIKKNVIYDLLHDNNVERIHADGVFQYYDLRWLAEDLDRIIAHNLPLVNLATEPVSTRDVARHAFGRDFDNRPDGMRSGLYDMRSVHAHVWNGHDGYLYGRDAVLDGLAAFVRSERAA
ncbi:hypothetical protein Lsed01_00651 [Demequina sediminis]|uniref:NAD(P)-dependent oxidoreductase n=1 Tax=Demequina sediminis TaxID=1930058 RepID=A0ABP9WEF8_9MICO|nr:hypothetical protein [Demequina sediminis]BDZ62013.1 hypothetical protein GCM10025873_18040 [Demequina sediminis]